MKRPKGLSDSTLLSLWRKAVHKSWKGKCALCGSEEELECHHVVPRRHRLLRFDVRNGLLLCKMCHKLIPTLWGQRVTRELFAAAGELTSEYLEYWEMIRYADELTTQKKNDTMWRKQEKEELEGVI